MSKLDKKQRTTLNSGKSILNEIYQKMERIRDVSLNNTMHGNEITREDAMNIQKNG